MAKWRVKYREEFPDVFKTLQNRFGDCSQGAAFIALKDAYIENIKAKNSDFTKRSIQFFDWVLVQGREDMAAICQACFVEHAFEKLDEEDITFLKPFLTSELKIRLKNLGYPKEKIE